MYPTFAGCAYCIWPGAYIYIYIAQLIGRNHNDYIYAAGKQSRRNEKVIAEIDSGICVSAIKPVVTLSVWC